MEIPAWSYSLFWVTISVVFSKLGFQALDKTELSNTVSPGIIIFFKHSLALSALCSSLCAFVFSPQLKIKINNFLMFLMLYSTIVLSFAYYNLGLSAYWYFCVFAFGNICISLVFIVEPSLSTCRTSPEFKLGLLANVAVGSSVILVGNKKRLLPCIIISIVVYIATCLMVVSQNERLRKLLPLVERVKEILSILKKKKGRLIEFGFGMVGTILFQNFFRLTSFNHVVAFLYLAVAWVANLALVRASDDLGIFHFLLSNVIVGCTVSQFGLRGTTWLVYGASLLLFGLKLKLESASLVRNDREIDFIVL